VPSPSKPLWKQLFDALDQRLSPTIDALARSDDVATLIALGKRARSDLERRAEHLSRRALHSMNMPAGSDVNRLLVHIARLEREVRDLRKQFTAVDDATYLAALQSQRGVSTSARPKSKPARSSRTTKRSADHRIGA